jgi:hypothetical protein
VLGVARVVATLTQTLAPEALVAKQHFSEEKLLQSVTLVGAVAEAVAPFAAHPFAVGKAVVPVLSGPQFTLAAVVT